MEFDFIFSYFTRDFNCQILNIDKLRNRAVQKKFLTELKLACEKHKDKSLTQLVKLLFHGTKNTKPDVIYNGSQGLDMRFSQKGLYGEGIYFADGPNYSDAYAHIPDSRNPQVKQMFLVFVLIGDPCEMKESDNSLRLPPLKPDGSNERFDSVFNAVSRHTIIYENSRQYPAYLVTYRKN